MILLILYLINLIPLLHREELIFLVDKSKDYLSQELYQKKQIFIYLMIVSLLSTMQQMLNFVRN